MKYYVAYSMGICSAYVAATWQDACNSPLCIFNDTCAEDIDTYRFGDEVRTRWGLDFLEHSRGGSVYDYFKENKIIPARQIPACSIKFKIEPFNQVAATLAPGAIAIGYEVGEEDRAEKLAAAWKHDHLTPVFPLIEQGISKDQCFGYFIEHGITPPRIYRHFRHANCIPCKNYRENDWIALRYHYPERFKWAKEFEGETGLRWMQDGPNLVELEARISVDPKKRRRLKSFEQPAFSFESGCDSCRRN